ncbi:PRD domain-containing protein [Cellulomonas sp.]|uniref:PRD domain-containing protein n=1 Tax=Cellulomonas sp. TaxID=40001 RepID=UPI002D44765B|nr:PRD domain-containing protein [Cellulomonas sp.]HYQ74593.1 PRD domain-containing protein [Cellulomonas sp.]
MRVTKVFNNNVLLAADDAGAEVVLMGKGLGFQVHAGDAVRTADVERTFVAGGGTTPERIVALLEEIPAEDIDLTQRIVAEARDQLGTHITGHVVVPLADHISFALRRAREDVQISYPLQWEVLHLYPREVAFARRALELVRESTGVELPALEAVPLALHFVNAQFGAGELSRTVEMTEVFGAVLGIVRSRLGVELDEESIDVARFITHLRYLFVRQQQGAPPPDVQGVLLAAVRSQHPDSVAAAVAIQDLLRERYDWTVTGDEVLYLALHVARLTGAVA